MNSIQGMDSIFWLIAANAAIWLGLGSYLAFMAARLRTLSVKLNQLESFRNESDN